MSVLKAKLLYGVLLCLTEWRYAALWRFVLNLFQTSVVVSHQVRANRSRYSNIPGCSVTVQFVLYGTSLATVMRLGLFGPRSCLKETSIYRWWRRRTLCAFLFFLSRGGASQTAGNDAHSHRHTARAHQTRNSGEENWRGGGGNQDLLATQSLRQNGHVTVTSLKFRHISVCNRMLHHVSFMLHVCTSTCIYFPVLKLLRLSGRTRCGDLHDRFSLDISMG